MTESIETALLAEVSNRVAFACYEEVPPNVFTELSIYLSSILDRTYALETNTNEEVGVSVRKTEGGPMFLDVSDGARKARSRKRGRLRERLSGVMCGVARELFKGTGRHAWMEVMGNVNMPFTYSVTDRAVANEIQNRLRELTEARS